MLMNWTIQKQHANMSIREYLRTVHKFSSRLITAIIHHGGRIEVNLKQQRVNYYLKMGDELTVQFPPEKKSQKMKAEYIPLEIIYEDDHLMVINKPSQIATMPSLNDPTGTIANGLLAYYETYRIPYAVHIVTRLDRDTSGLMLIAKHRYCHSLLASAHEHGRLKRKYEAIVHGHLQNKTGTINLRIGRKEGSIVERIVSETGKVAITHFKVVEILNNHSHIHIDLETGRTHQIRVHFSHLGHPLVGDDLYGGSIDHMKRQALHCCELSFVHPITDDKLTFKLPLPPDMKKFIVDHPYKK